MYNFSVEIPDSIAESFEKKLKAASELGINNVEIREKIDGLLLHEMNGEQTERMRDLLIDHGKRIVLLSSDISPEDGNSLNLLFRRALTLNVKGIKLTPGQNDDMSLASRLAESYGIPVLFENSSDSFLKDESSLCELIKKSGDFSVIFNPYEFVRTEKHPFFHVFYGSRIKNRIAFLRINDGLYITHEPVMLHQGCAEVKELASILLARSFDGYFSFAPYLPNTTLDTYRESIAIFRSQLKNM